MSWLTLLVARIAVRRLNQQAGQMVSKGQRVWEPTPAEPSLVIIVDEYAEMPEEAHDCADFIAERGRAVVVNLIAATPAAKPGKPWAKAPSAPRWLSASACASGPR